MFKPWAKFSAILLVAVAAMGLRCEPEKAASETKSQNDGDVSKYFNRDPKAEQAEADRLAAETEEKILSETATQQGDEKILFIEISKPDGQVPAGQNMQLKLIAIAESGSRRTITDEAAWSVSDATILESLHGEQPGLVHGARAGTATVIAEFETLRAESVLTVSAPEFKLYEISPDSLTLGTSQKFRLHAVYSDGSRIDVSQDAVWSSDKVAVAIMDTDKTEKGFVKGLAKGEFTLKGTVNGQVIGRPVRVTLSQITGLETFNVGAVTCSGTIQNLKAEATFATGAKVDITQSVEWTVDNDEIATVDNVVGTKGKFTAGLGGVVEVTATIDDFTDSISINVTQDTFVSFAITPVGVKIPKGMKRKFNLTGTRANGSTQNISEDAIWTSDNPLIATVSNDGELSGTVEAYELGTIQLSAQYGQDVTVIPVEAIGPAVIELDVRASTSAISCGSTAVVTYQAFGKLSDDSEIEVSQDVVWSVLNTTYATVSNAPGTEGKITTLSEGNTEVKAVYEVPETGDTLEAKRALTVNAPALTGYTVDLPMNSIAMGNPLQAVAKGSYACTRPGIYIFTTAVTWSTSNSAISNVSNITGSKGLITTSGSIATNTTITITATKDGLSGTASLTIRPKEVNSVTFQLLSGTIQTGQSVSTLVSISFSDGSSAFYDPVSFPAYTLNYAQKGASFAQMSINMTDRTITGVLEGWLEIEATLVTNIGTTFTDRKPLNINSPCTNGILSNYLCWQLSNLDESCEDFCPRVGGTYHTRTDWSSTGHPWGNTEGRRICSEVIYALNGATLVAQSLNAPDSQGVGCSMRNTEGVSAARVYQNIAASPSAKHSTINRACACRMP